MGIGPRAAFAAATRRLAAVLLVFFAVCTRMSLAGGRGGSLVQTTPSTFCFAASGTFRLSSMRRYWGRRWRNVAGLHLAAGKQRGDDVHGAGAFTDLDLAASLELLKKEGILLSWAADATKAGANKSGVQQGRVTDAMGKKAGASDGATTNPRERAGKQAQGGDFSRRGQALPHSEARDTQGPTIVWGSAQSRDFLWGPLLPQFWVRNDQDFPLLLFKGLLKGKALSDALRHASQLEGREAELIEQHERTVRLSRSFCLFALLMLG